MADREDIVLITVDSLRTDHCSYAGYERETTPGLDALAADGLVFENAIAPAVATRGSASSFFTGEYPIPRESAESRGEELRRHVEARDTLPERLSRRGYETIAFTANPWTSRFFSFDQGFDRFEDFMDTDLSSSWVQNDDDRGTLSTLLVQFANWWQGQDMYMAWEAFYDDVRTAIEDATSPYFVWIFLVDVHMPYLPGSGYRTYPRLLTYLANAWLYSDGAAPFEPTVRDVLTTTYDDTIQYTDAFLQQLTEDVAAADEDPLVIFHADHGEEFGEHGAYGHGANLHEETVNVPLVVSNGPTGAVTEPFSLYQLPELVLSLASGDGYEDLVGPYARSRNYQPKRAVRGDGWKYVSTPTGEATYEVRDRDDHEFVDDRLRKIGRDIVASWEADEAEKSRLIEAAAAVPTDRI